MTLANLKAICAGALPKPRFYANMEPIGPQDARYDLEDLKAARDYFKAVNPQLVLAMLECLEAAQSMRDILLVGRDDVTVQPYDTKRAALNEMLRGMR